MSRSSVQVGSLAPLLPMPHTIFSVEQLAEYLHISPGDVQRLIRSEGIPYEETGNRVVFRKRDVDAWASQRIMGLRSSELKEFHKTSAAQADEAGGSPTVLSQYIQAAYIEPTLAAKTRAAVIRTMVKVGDRTELVYDPDDLRTSLEERESLCSTAMAGGYAVLHPRHHEPYMFAEPFLVLGRTPTPIPFGAPDGARTDLFFLLCCPNDRIHLHLLSRLCLVCREASLLNDLRDAESAVEMLEHIVQADKETARRR